jgi:hypothetical protein
MFWRIFVFSVFPLLFSACAEKVVFTDDCLSDCKQPDSREEIYSLEECLVFRNGFGIFQNLPISTLNTAPECEKLPDTRGVDFQPGSCAGALSKKGEEKEVFGKIDILQKSGPHSFNMWKIADWYYLWLIDSYYAQYVQDFRGKVHETRYRVDEYICKCSLRCKPWKKLEIIFERDATIEYRQVWLQYLGKNLSDSQRKAIFRAAEKKGILKEAARF